MKKKEYSDFLDVGKCFYNNKRKIKKIGKDNENNIVDCFKLPVFKNK